MEKTLIEKRNTEGAYGMISEQMIVDTDKHGRLLVVDGFGGGDVEGQCYRWRHGKIIKLQPDDTFESLENGEWNETCNLYEAVSQGYDDTRPLQEWLGIMIQNFVKGLI